MLPAIFEYTIAMLSFVQKWQCQLNARECDIKEKLNQNDSRIIPWFGAISKIFADIYYQYIDIRQMKTQTEITLSSCSILFLKTLFKLLPQCSLVPYLQRDLCKDENELDNCDSTVV